MAHQQAHTYRVVDVFTEEPLQGNPLAVFPDASGIEDALLQKIARELNLSETVFVFPSAQTGHAARLRIFTPLQEIPFAGHPTVGTGFVLLDEGAVAKGVEHFILEEKIGPVSVRVEHGDRPVVWLKTPPIQFGPTFDAALCANQLGLKEGDLLPVTPQEVSAGNPNIFIALRDRAAVDRAWADVNGIKQIRGGRSLAQCAFVFAPEASGAYSRMFAPEHGIAEDPATGSATGPLAAYMMKNKLISGAPGTRFVSEQGTKMGRRSILHVQIHGEQGAGGIDVGGYVTPLVKATMQLS